MSENKVTFGLEKVHIAFLDDSGAAPAWGQPRHIPGAVNFSPEPQGENSSFAADNNTTYWSADSNDGYNGDLQMALVPDDALAEMLGWEIDSNGMLVEIADGKQKPFALMFEVKGDQKNRRNVYYNCMASRPGKEHATKAGAVEPSTDTLSLRIMPLEVNEKSIVKSVIELDDTNAAVYNGFFNAVTLPGAEPAAADKTALAAAIALGDTLDELDYTAGSWTTFSNALAAAVIVNDDADAAQSEVNAAKEALTEAILALVPAAG